MALNAPTKLIFLLSLIIALVALAVALNVLSFVPLRAVWIMTVAYVVLAAGSVFKGL